MTTRFPRWLEYEGYDNFRDLGGWAARDGRAVRWQRLYRSGAFIGSAAPPPIRPTDLFDVRTVVDLRTAQEIGAEEQASWLDGVASRHVRLPLANPEPDAIRSAGVAGMGDLYLANFDSKVKAFGRILTVLAEPGNLPVVVRCRGGKDRTGILIALILDLLGLPEETIIEEYVLTDERFSRIPPKVYEETAARLTALGLDPEILRTRPQTMARFLEGLREKWGTAEEVAKGAGADDEVIAAVRSNLLE